MAEVEFISGDVDISTSKNSQTTGRRCYDAYTNDPGAENKLRTKLREEARNRLLQNETEKIPSDEEIDAFYELLKQNRSMPSVEDIEMIRYDAYRRALDRAPSLVKAFIPPVTFLSLQSSNPDDPYGRVPISAIIEYLRLRKEKMSKIIALNYYDSNGKGFLTTESNGLLARDYYLNIAVRKFFFFLDPMRHKRIRIIDVVASGFLEEMESAVGAPNSVDEPKEKSSDATSSNPIFDEPLNWFAKANCQRIADLYLQLDTDGNGLLSYAEMADFRRVTNAFMQRVFEVHQSYENNEIDLRGFCDLLLAMDNKSVKFLLVDPASVTYYFRILDVDEDGYLGASDLAFFYKDLAALYEECYGDDVLFPPPLFEDIKDEIFDMCRPKDPFRISLKELIESGQGGTIVGMITDLDCLLEYENREEPGRQEDL
ncbi:unnamed protein product [Toxocara canis]|uniref:Serine/threonine-protein phosphatase 2A regulatory subunit B'' subunit gamma n=1 Tax=Toxocara canis TaxID=6265 RepID=A0A183V7P7_TOXCA|nr:unnamed protein product [Toxocara canis]